MTKPKSRMDDLINAINHLSDKDHVISKEALRAKADFDKSKQVLKDDDADLAAAFQSETTVPDSTDSPSDTAHMREFNDNIRIMARIFAQSRFDEFLFHLLNPGRFFILQFLSGFIRGLGFGTAVFVIGCGASVLIANAMPLRTFRLLVYLLTGQ